MALREYIFFCEKCAYEFSEFVDWDNISKYKAKCGMCKSSKKVVRSYSSEKVSGDTGPKTVGMLADRQANKGLKNDSEKAERQGESSFKVEKIDKLKGRAKRI